MYRPSKLEKLKLILFNRLLSDKVKNELIYQLDTFVKLNEGSKKDFSFFHRWLLFPERANYLRQLHIAHERLKQAIEAAKKEV